MPEYFTKPFAVEPVEGEYEALQAELHENERLTKLKTEELATIPEPAPMLIRGVGGTKIVGQRPSPRREQVLHTLWPLTRRKDEILARMAKLREKATFA
jgi:hypothetical protein